MDGKEILIVTDILLVGGTEKALAKRKVINRVEDVGLAGTVKPHETIHLLRKQQVGRFAVLEVGQFQFVEIHLFDFGTRDCGTTSHGGVPCLASRSLASD